MSTQIFTSKSSHSFTHENCRLAKGLLHIGDPVDANILQIANVNDLPRDIRKLGMMYEDKVGWHANADVPPINYVGRSRIAEFFAAACRHLPMVLEQQDGKTYRFAEGSGHSHACLPAPMTLYVLPGPSPEYRGVVLLADRDSCRSQRHQ